MNHQRLFAFSSFRSVAVTAATFAQLCIGCTAGNGRVETATTLSQHLATGTENGTGDGTGRPTTGSSDVVDRPENPGDRSGAPSPIALVNGRPIDSRRFVRTLVEARGLQLLQQMIFLEAVRAEAEKRNVTVSQADIEREYDLTLKSVAPEDGDENNTLTEMQREALVDEWTRRNGVPRDELAIAMARQSLLRKLASAEVRVTGDDVRAEIERTRGERVVVRHLQLPAPRAEARVRARLKRGDPFEELVADYSVNALTKANGGLLPPFTRDDPTVPRAFATVAFGLKPGEVSPLFESEGGYHIIKLERQISPEAGPLGNDRKRIERALHERRTTERMQSLGREILDGAKVRIDEATLRRQYDDRRKRGLIEGPALAN